MPKIIPAILTDDLSDAKEKLQEFQKLSDWIQIDVMDGNFVPQKSFNFNLVNDLKTKPGVCLELHLMVEDPLSFIRQCRNDSIKRVIFHFESLNNAAEILEVLNKLKNLKLQAGIAINPPTPVENIFPYLDKINVVLFLSVNPGRQGQEFMPEVLDKVRLLKEKNWSGQSAIDGGINKDNIKKVVAAGVDLIAVGSYLTKYENVNISFEELEQALY